MIRNFDVDKFKTLIGLAGLGLLGGQTIEAIFNLVRNYPMDTVINILWFLALMDGEEVNTDATR